MTRARFVVSLPEGTWLGDLSRERPDTTVRLRAGLGTEQKAVGLCWLTAPDIEAVLAAIDAHPAVEAVGVFDRTDTEAIVQFETNDSLLLWPALDAGVPVEFPIEIIDGEAVLDVVGDPDRITALGQTLESLAAGFTIEYIRDDDHSTQLTRTQCELLRTALAEGYYDTPRRCSLTDLANEIGLAKSTVSETLHRAEGVVVRSFLRTVSHRNPAIEEV